MSPLRGVTEKGGYELEGRVLSLSVEFEHGEECLLRHLHVSDFLHAFFTPFLFFEEFSFS